MYMLVRFCLPMVELGSFEYACPGYTTVSSSRLRSVSIEAVVHRLRIGARQIDTSA